MKTTISLISSALLGLIILTLVSCQQEAVLSETATTLDAADVQHDADYHGINLENAELKPFYFPDGTSEDRYFLEGDIVVTQEEFLNMQKEAVDNIVLRQYSTNALISDGTYRVLGYTGGQYALSSKMRTGLVWAINNYNNLGLDINFTLDFGTANLNAYDIVIYNVNNGQAGGSAGFPSFGNPYKWVQIYSGMNAYSNNVNEHVMTHEIGHCIGLRHTDYFNRLCDGSNEGSAGIGANHVPGTPTSIDYNSVMISCFNSGEDGEFGYYDRVALRQLY